MSARPCGGRLALGDCGVMGKPMRYKYWSPSISTKKYGMRPDVGDWIGFAYDRRPYEVVRIEEIPSVTWDETDYKTYEAAHRFYRRDREWPDKDEWKGRPFTLIMRRLDLPESNGLSSFKVRPGNGIDWYILPEHYAVCSQCGELTPCGDYMAEQEANAQGKILERRMRVLPGCCWSCAKPVTKRMKAIEFEGENLELPGGPPVVFHMRRDCRQSAKLYEAKWLQADPSRKRRLTCPGGLVQHYDGLECSEGDECPDLGASHPSWVDHSLYYEEKMLGRLMKAGGFPAVDAHYGDPGVLSMKGLELVGENAMGWRCSRCRNAYMRGEPMAKHR